MVLFPHYGHRDGRTKFTALVHHGQFSQKTRGFLLLVPGFLLLTAYCLFLTDLKVLDLENNVPSPPPTIPEPAGAVHRSRGQHRGLPLPW